MAPEPAKYGSILNLNGYDAGDAYADIAGATATVIDDAVSGGKALQIVNSGGADAAAVLTISGDTVKTIASFDYFVIKARLLMDSAATNTNVNLQVSNVSGRPSWGDYAAATSGNGTEYEWVFDKVTNSFTFTPETNSFTVTFKKWDAAKLTVIVTEISGGYYDIETEEGQSVDLTEKFSLSAAEFSATFTPEGGEVQSVSNLTAFAPTAKRCFAAHREQGWLYRNADVGQCQDSDRVLRHVRFCGYVAIYAVREKRNNNV